MAPGGPSSTVPAAAAPGASGGATITGTVVGVSSGSAIRTHGSNISVTVAGTTTSTTVDDRGRFVLEHVPAGRVDLRFSGPNVDVHLELADVAERASVVITVRISGSTAQLDDETREGPNNETEIEGLVAAKGTATLTVNAKIIEVSSTTQIVHGDTAVAFSSIGLGDRVHVKGSANGATVLARKIEVQHQVAAPPQAPNDHDDGDDHGDDQGGDNHGGAQAELKGAIAGLGGSCPTLSFTISGTPVRTNGSTQFKDTACSALRSGNAVEVKGTRQADRSVLASRVEKK